MKRLLAAILLLTLLTAPALATTYTDRYPTSDSDHVNATHYYDAASYAPWKATNPLTPLTGSRAPNSWLTSDPAGNRLNNRFHIDLGTDYIIRRVNYSNAHSSGAFTDTGSKTFTVWGSNSGISFLNLAYDVDANWTELTASVAEFSQHVSADTADPRNFTIENSISYRYYAFKISDNWGATDYTGLRRIALQTEDGYTPTPAPSAAFNCTPTSGTSPVSVFCYDNSSGGTPTSWYWMFGDGNTSTMQHPNNTYRPWGLYSVNFSATNAGGTSWSNQSNLINITAPVGAVTPITVWSVNSQTIVFPGRIIGNDSSRNTPTAWCWSFGDGSVILNTNNVTYQYTKRGVWNMSLNASNTAGSNTTYKLIRILGFSQGAGIGTNWREVASLEYGTYSTSRELDSVERAKTDCKVVGIC